MNTLRSVFSTLVLLPLWLALLPAASAAGGFSGTTLQGQPFKLEQRKGRVVMVVLWRTDCPVCLDKMQELRDNARGWKDKPFDLVLINLDRDRADAAAHDQARRLVDSKTPLWSLWRGDVQQMPAAWLQPPRLPVLLIFNSEGQQAKRHEGRVPPEAWDDVAELLP
jgi:thiol-disulfide isomerase/thioredoxin